MKVNERGVSPQALENMSGANKNRSLQKKGSLDPSGNHEGGAAVEISDNARLVTKAMAAVRSTPDLSANKVADLKKRIQEGNYKVDAEKVAEKILEEHLNYDFGKNRL